MRYSEFDRFHTVFKVGSAAELPPKKYFFNMELSFVKQRMEALQIYLNLVIKTYTYRRYLIDFLSAKAKVTF